MNISVHQVHGISLSRSCRVGRLKEHGGQPRIFGNDLFDRFNHMVMFLIESFRHLAAGHNRLSVLVGDIDDLVHSCSFRLRLAAAQHEGIQAGFVDDIRLTLTPYVQHSPFIFIKTIERLRRILNLKHAAHVRRHEPRLAVKSPSYALLIYFRNRTLPCSDGFALPPPLWAQNFHFPDPRGNHQTALRRSNLQRPAFSSA